jgi:class 3 adenylate cyclase/tetratricopeptide (TPR) repeat protein
MTIEQRRLAAILLADVVGYSRLMGADERNTLVSLRSLRTEILEPKLREHGGRLVKTMGDGFLVEFGSAVNAVSCAVAVQQALAHSAGGLEGERSLRLRIGINVGDIVVEGDDIFGDGVNVAARLQSIAEPGSICVSKVVADQLRGRLDVRLDALGPQHVKNIAQPVEAYRVVPAGGTAAEVPPQSAWSRVRPVQRFRKPMWIAALVVGIAIAGLAVVKLPTIYGPTRGTAPALSVAVMPFVASSDDPDARRAAETLSRDVARSVSRDTTGPMGPRLRLVSSDAGPAQVRYRIEGNVGRAPTRIVLHVRVVTASGGDQIWADRGSIPESELAGGFSPALQELKRRLNRAIKAAERKRVLDLPVSVLTAPELLLRAGEARAGGESLVNLRESRRYVDEALRLDPRYARAWGMKGMLVNLEGDIDPNQDRERIGREQDEFTARAVALDPMDAVVWGQRSNALVYLSRWDAALEAVNEAARLDPDEASEHRLSTAWILGLMGRPDEALAIVDEVVRVDPTLSAGAARTACEAHVLAGHASQAVGACEKSVLLYGDWISKVYLLAAYANSGQTAKADAVKVEILRDVPTYSIAQLRAKRYSDHPDYLALAERNSYAGLRKAGIPEQ